MQKLQKVHGKMKAKINFCANTFANEVFFYKTQFLLILMLLMYAISKSFASKKKAINFIFINFKKVSCTGFNSFKYITSRVALNF